MKRPRRDLILVPSARPARPLRTLALGSLVLLGGAFSVAATEAEPPAPGAIAIIIDDLGNRGDADLRAVALPGPVACAILPHTPYAERLAVLARDRGKEVLLHLPLQPVDEEWQSGRGAITLDTTRQQFAASFAANLAAIPYVAGVSSHMGSLLTRHPGHMLWLMQELRAREELFFVDSYTTPGSVAMQLAAENKVRAAKRDVFLDRDPTAAAVAEQLERLKRIATRRGSAIAIGHPYPATLEVLERQLPRLSDAGYRLVSVAEIVRLRTSGDSSWQAYSYHSQKALKK